MANPTAKTGGEVMDYTGLALRVNQIQDESGNVLLGGTQGATIATLTDSTTGTANDTVSDVGGAFSQATLNNNFADLTAKVNAIINALIDAGIIAD